MCGMGFLGGHTVLDQLRPHLALAVPVGDSGDWADILLTDRITAFDRAGQKQERILDPLPEIDVHYPVVFIIIDGSFKSDLAGVSRVGQKPKQTAFDDRGWILVLFIRSSLVHVSPAECGPPALQSRGVNL